MASIRLRCLACQHVSEWDGRGRRPRCSRVFTESDGHVCGGPVVKLRGGKIHRDDLKAAEHCREQRTIAESKLKRAMTSIELWSKRERYYLDKAAGKIKRSAKPAGGKVRKADRLTRAIDLDA